MIINKEFMEYKWYGMSKEECIKVLNSSVEGLTQKEAFHRIKKFGKNKKSDYKFKYLFQVFLKNCLQGILPFLIFFIGFFFEQEPKLILVEKIVLFLQVTLISIFSFLDWYFTKQLDAKNPLTNEKYTVIRDGNEQTIHVSQIVPGDLLKISEGMEIPADLRIIYSEDLIVDEKNIGISDSHSNKDFKTIGDDFVPLNKITNCCFYGSNVVSGTGLGIIFHTSHHRKYNEFLKISKKNSSDFYYKKKDFIDRNFKIWLFSFFIVLILLGSFLAVGYNEYITYCSIFSIIYFLLSNSSFWRIIYYSEILKINSFGLDFFNISNFSYFNKKNTFLVDLDDLLENRIPTIRNLGLGNGKSFLVKTDGYGGKVNYYLADESPLIELEKKEIINFANNLSTYFKFNTTKDFLHQAISSLIEKTILVSKTEIQEKKQKYLITNKHFGQSKIFILEKAEEREFFIQGSVDLLQQCNRNDTKQILNKSIINHMIQKYMSEGLDVICFAKSSIPKWKSFENLEDLTPLTFLGFICVQYLDEKEFKADFLEFKKRNFQCKFVSEKNETFLKGFFESSEIYFKDSEILNLHTLEIPSQHSEKLNKFLFSKLILGNIKNLIELISEYKNHIYLFTKKKLSIVKNNLGQITVTNSGNKYIDFILHQFEWKLFIQVYDSLNNILLIQKRLLQFLLTIFLSSIIVYLFSIVMKFNNFITPLQLLTILTQQTFLLVLGLIYYKESNIIEITKSKFQSKYILHPHFLKRVIVSSIVMIFIFGMGLWDLKKNRLNLAEQRTNFFVLLNMAYFFYFLICFQEFSSFLQLMKSYKIIFLVFFINLIQMIIFLSISKFQKILEFNQLDLSFLMKNIVILILMFTLFEYYKFKKRSKFKRFVVKNTSSGPK